MRHIFQSFWIGESISPYEALALRSFIDHGHRFHLYCYSRRLQVPKGVELRDAGEILPRDRCFSYRSGFGAGSFAACSNLFRYLLLARVGGWWVDTDVICLSDRIPDFDRFYALEDDDFINGAVLRFEPGDTLLDACLGDALNAGEDVSWGQIGPRLITRKAKELGQFKNAQPREQCYPLHWSRALDLLDRRQTAAIAAATESSLMLHLWNEIFRQGDVCKTLLPPRGSMLRRLADAHPVSGWTGRYTLPRRFPRHDLAAHLRKAELPLLLNARYWARDKVRDQVLRLASVTPLDKAA